MAIWAISLPVLGSGHLSIRSVEYQLDVPWIRSYLDFHFSIFKEAHSSHLEVRDFSILVHFKNALCLGFFIIFGLVGFFIIFGLVGFFIIFGLVFFSEVRVFRLALTKSSTFLRSRWPSLVGSRTYTGWPSSGLPRSGCPRSGWPRSAWPGSGRPRSAWPSFYREKK